MKMILLTILPILSILFLIFILYNFKKHLFEKPLADDLTSNDNFYIEDFGKYSIWAKMNKKGISNLVKESPLILHRNGYEIDLRKQKIPTHFNTFKYVSRKLYVFDVNPGQYYLKIIDKPYSDLGSRFFSNSNKEYIPVKYRIKKNYSFLSFFLSVWTLILAIFCILFTVFIATSVITI